MVEQTCLYFWGRVLKSEDFGDARFAPNASKCKSLKGKYCVGNAKSNLTASESIGAVCCCGRFRTCPHHAVVKLKRVYM